MLTSLGFVIACSPNNSQTTPSQAPARHALHLSLSSPSAQSAQFLAVGPASPAAGQVAHPSRARSIPAPRLTTPQSCPPNKAIDRDKDAGSHRSHARPPWRLSRRPPSRGPTPTQPIPPDRGAPMSRPTPTPTPVLLLLRPPPGTQTAPPTSAAAARTASTAMSLQPTARPAPPA